MARAGLIGTPHSRANHSTCGRIDGTVNAMPAEGAAGFWSYAHDDNKLDDGAILKLANMLSEEFDLLAGEPLELFIDRDGIDWGDLWRERINSALAQTTFLIPIITPRYFRQPECRRELQEFAAKAKGLGTEELLLPILYVKPQGFAEDSSDDLVALVAKTQYVDWQENRLLESNSRAYRKEVNALAHRLLGIARRVAEDQLSQELNADLDDNAMDGLVDLVESTTKLLPEWLDAVLGDRVTDAQLEATWHQCWDHVLKLRRAHAPASAVAAAQIRAAKEMLPIIERFQKDSKTYLAKSIELDPLISEMIRQTSAHPESIALIMPIRAAVNEAIINIKRDIARIKAMKEGDGHSIEGHFEEMKHLGRLFQKCYAIFISGDRATHEGSQIVMRWDTEFNHLDKQVNISLA
jgi:TIR domain